MRAPDCWLPPFCGAGPPRRSSACAQLQLRVHACPGNSTGVVVAIQRRAQHCGARVVHVVVIAACGGVCVAHSDAVACSVCAVRALFVAGTARAARVTGSTRSACRACCVSVARAAYFASCARLADLACLACLALYASLACRPASRRPARVQAHARTRALMHSCVAACVRARACICVHACLRPLRSHGVHEDNQGQPRPRLRWCAHACTGMRARVWACARLQLLCLACNAMRACTMRTRMRARMIGNNAAPTHSCAQPCM